MRNKPLVVIALVVFMLSLGLSFSATVDKARAGDGCELLCIDFCLCQMSMWSGKWHDGYCDLNMCGPLCYGEGIPCL